MKPLYCSLLISLFFLNGLFGQSCLPDGIVFTTQGQIDSFAVNYPGCTEILGSVEIGSYTTRDVFSNITGLGQLASIQGNLDIYYNNNLSSLEGLENLTSVGNDLYIGTNFILENLEGLNNLTFVGGDLRITANSQLINLVELGDLNFIGGRLHVSTSGSMTSLDGLQNVTTIGENLMIQQNSSLNSLNGLQNLSIVGGTLSIAGNDLLTDLDELQSVTSVGEGLTITSNDALTNLDGLQNITATGAYLNVSSNSTLVNLSGLQNITSVGSYLNIIGNVSLSSLEGLTGLQSVGGNFQISDNIVLTDISALSNLKTISGSISMDENSMLPNLDGMNNITAISGILVLRDHPALNDISGISNIGTGIDILMVYNNPNLSACAIPSICNFLSYNDFSAPFAGNQINNNALGCESRQSVLSDCAGFANIKTVAFYDQNQNQNQDSGEQAYNDVSILIEPGNFITFPNANFFPLPPGNYTATYDQSYSPNWALTTDSTSYFLSLNTGELDTISFGIYPLQQISDVTISITSPPARCNEEIAFDISTRNTGTTIVSGVTWLEIDSNITSVNFIDLPDTIVAPDLYGWNYSDLYPGQIVVKQIALGIPGPPVFPVGDFLYFESYSNYTDANGNNQSPEFHYIPEVRCSFDPNDKLVNPDRTNAFSENYTLFDESLFYTIRFQNTGNDVAYHVSIKDTLDSNLDKSTFQLLGTSHPDELSTSMSADGILTFDFPYIFLPDSTSNFEASQGYVSYLIKPNVGLPENTIIKNSAGIYFDSNPPVITNTTENVLVGELPVISVLEPDEPLEFSIHPNPNTGLFEIQGLAQADYTIFNIAGQIVQQGQLTDSHRVDISNVPQGVYILSILTDGKITTERIVKM